MNDPIPDQMAKRFSNLIASLTKDREIDQRTANTIRDLQEYIREADRLIPHYSTIGSMKLQSILNRNDGWKISGYCVTKISNGEYVHGFATVDGFVGWWLPAYYPTVNLKQDTPPV